MQYPNFYTHIPTINLYDSLSDFLGTVSEGLLEITYLDCVKLAGHSCPTVAGAYLMTQKGLSALYRETLPQRGSIKVEMKNSEEVGVTGVLCNVVSYIIGANGVGGFKGIQGNFSRDNLIAYNIPMNGELKLTRLDTEENVTLSYNPSFILPDEKMDNLMQKNLQGLATKEEKDSFQILWQNRVEKILLTSELHDKIITIKKG